MSLIAVSTDEQTLENLFVTFDGESNTPTRYAPFAIETDEEGYLKLGSLLHTPSPAAQSHAVPHVKVMRKVAARTTLKNLQAAVALDLYEADILHSFAAEGFAHSSVTSELHEASITSIADKGLAARNLALALYEADILSNFANEALAVETVAGERYEAEILCRFAS